MRKFTLDLITDHLEPEIKKLETCWLGLCMETRVPHSVLVHELSWHRPLYVNPLLILTVVVEFQLKVSHGPDQNRTSKFHSITSIFQSPKLASTDSLTLYVIVLTDTIQ